jgi:hypothetical protein
MKQRRLTLAALASSAQLLIFDPDQFTGLHLHGHYRDQNSIAECFWAGKGFGMQSTWNSWTMWPAEDFRPIRDLQQLLADRQGDWIELLPENRAGVIPVGSDGSRRSRFLINEKSRQTD